MEIKQLKTFKTVATLMSFTQAAKKLNYAQSSISAQIQMLEEELDVKLFDRMGLRILLTDAGERLLQYAGKIIDLEEETRNEVAEAKEPQGSLTIRIPESFGVHHLPSVLKQFRIQFPKVGLKFITCAHEGLQEDLRKGVTDLAFLLTESITAGNIMTEVLGVETLVIAASPDHPLAAKPIVTINDLAGETVLISRVDCSYLKSFQRILIQKKIHPGTLLELNSVSTIIQCIREGIGITVLPRIAVEDDLDQGRLVALPLEDGELEVALLMIWYKEKWLSPTLRAFMKIAREILKG
ncbi:MAG: LysR family transcriptional regulator [Desulfobacterium sp.]|nr:LysR family transcriptional regulator [Desulfobacterium sp.]